jgi:Leucine-rich repeat (LRR) protein
MSHLALLSTSDVLQVPKAAWDSSEPVEDDTTPWWSVEVIKSLNFRGNQITEIPAELFTLTDVQSLNFCSNELQQIPSEISKLTDLRILLLSENRCALIHFGVARSRPIPIGFQT